MEQCPKCNAQLIDPQSEYCSECGCHVATVTRVSASDANDDLDFVVTESASQDPEFVGGTSKFPTVDDDLDLQTTSDLVQDEGRMHSEGDHPHRTTQSGFSPIGQTDSPLPPSVDDAPTPPSPLRGAKVTPEPNPESLAETGRSNTSPQLADPGDEGLYLSDQEKEEIIRKIGNGKPVDQPASVSPSSSPGQPLTPTKAVESSANMPTPTIAKRGCGIAYFYRNYIQITGNQLLHAEDEVLVNDRTYKLKPKQVRPAFIIAAAATMFVAALILIGSFMLSTGDTGDGEVIGIVLDRSGEPFVHGAIIRFPELGHAVKSNAEGFFRSGDIPSGSHKMEYKVDGEVVAEEYITVVSGQVSTISLSPGGELNGSTQTSVSPPPQRTTVAQTESAQKPRSNSNSPSSKKTTSKPKPGSRYARVTLAANVEGARLSIDGKIIGAGNMTYSRIKAGKRNYVVEADGYAPVSGVISLKAGKTRKLEAVLQPMETAQKEQVYSAKDFYYSGVASVKAGEVTTAIDDFTKAIEQEPSYAEAYIARADVHAKLKKAEPAHDDYIRAAEIFRFEKNFNRAITAYNSAIDVKKKSVTAYLGRGDLYLAKGQEIAAVADYDAARKINKKNPAVHLGLGKARFQLDNYKKAIKHFKEARKLEPNNPITYQYLMLSYLAVDNLKEVKKTFKKFAEIANDAQMERMISDRKYTAVLRAVDED